MEGTCRGVMNYNTSLQMIQPSCQSSLGNYLLITTPQPPHNVAPQYARRKPRQWSLTSSATASSLSFTAHTHTTDRRRWKEEEGDHPNPFAFFWSFDEKSCIQTAISPRAPPRLRSPRARFVSTPWRLSQRGPPRPPRRSRSAGTGWRATPSRRGGAARSSTSTAVGHSTAGRRGRRGCRGRDICWGTRAGARKGRSGTAGRLVSGRRPRTATPRPTPRRPDLRTTTL